jgi:hypothetical protein
MERRGRRATRRIVWTIRDGQTVRIDYYSSAAEALEAVGLREWTRRTWRSPSPAVER